ncbi:MAG: hypothetical protein HY287_14455 [Planctomycetes bacterium]|nr:hypothetical protein [Planctomycetota bacterium]MBI3835524.1 hypothetical protein [Planctomycetota bacterium]
MSKIISTSGRIAITPVELFAVVGCVGLLAFLTYPSLQAARNSSKQDECLEHLHTIGQASLIYGGQEIVDWAIPVHPKFFSSIGSIFWSPSGGI